MVSNIHKSLVIKTDFNGNIWNKHKLQVMISLNSWP
jgi:hypothetical protein